jgi:Domain of unknown function (DUF4253)
MGDSVLSAWGLADGLPAGQWITPDPRFAREEPVAGPSLWITDDPVPDAAQLWARLLRAHPRSGLWPLLLVTLAPYGPSLARYLDAGEPGERFVRKHARRPWHAGELAPVPLAAVDAQDAGEILGRWWDQVAGQGGGALAARTPLPFDRWPGLAPASPGGLDPDEFAAALAESPGGLKELTGRDSGVHIGLVPAADGAAALASCGWISRRGWTEEDAAVIRSWQDRFGVRLCALHPGSVVLSVAWPPAPEQLLRVAAEHLAYETGEGLHDNGMPITFGRYAAELRDCRTWWFWWD